MIFIEKPTFPTEIQCLSQKKTIFPKENQPGNQPTSQPTNQTARQPTNKPTDLGEFLGGLGPRNVANMVPI